MAKIISIDPSLLSEGEEITVKTVTSGAAIAKILGTDDINSVPDPPETGTHFLMAVDGVIQWVEGAEFSCPT